MLNNQHLEKVEWIRTTLDQYEGPLTRYAHRITGDVERARDVVQETFLRLCKQEIEQLDGHLAEWLFTVCRNRALDVQRKESRMTELAHLEADSIEQENASPDSIVEQRETKSHVMAQLERLPQNQKEVVRLKFQNGLSYKEIGEVTGLSVSNVGYLIHNGLKALREMIRQAEPI